MIRMKRCAVRLLVLVILIFTFSSFSQAKGLDTILETAIGELVAGDLTDRFGLCDNHQSRSRFDQVALRLAPLANRKGINYKFNIL